MAPNSEIISEGWIEQKIFLIRGQKVILSNDLALLYGVTPKSLNQAVKRNKERFPEDFMFQITWDEASSEILRSQIVTLEFGKHIKYLPYAFTEQGVAMLSSVLRSDRAVMVNIEIVRTFVRLRAILSGHQELAQKVIELEEKYDSQFKIVFDAIRELMIPSPDPNKKQIGFRSEK